VLSTAHHAINLALRHTAEALRNSAARRPRKPGLPAASSRNSCKSVAIWSCPSGQGKRGLSTAGIVNPFREDGGRLVARRGDRPPVDSIAQCAICTALHCGETSAKDGADTIGGWFIADFKDACDTGVSDSIRGSGARLPVRTATSSSTSVNGGTW